jgi:hypothetical protein
MTDYLDLPGWTTTRIHRPAKKEVTASALFAPEPAACLKCGVVGETDRWGTKDTERPRACFEPCENTKALPAADCMLAAIKGDTH